MTTSPKKAAKPKAAPTEPTSPSGAATAPANPGPTAILIDELGSILGELATPEAQGVLCLAARAEQLKKAVRALVPDNTPGNQPFQKDGDKFRALLGPCGNQTVIDYRGLVERIGAEEYAKFAKASLKQLEDNVKPGILAFYLRTEQTGTRSLTVVAKGQPA